MEETVIIYDQIGCADIGFIVLDGDYRHFNNVYINDMSQELSGELCDILYDEEGNEKFELLEEFPSDGVMMGAYVIVAGFLP